MMLGGTASALASDDLGFLDLTLLLLLSSMLAAFIAVIRGQYKTSGCRTEEVAQVNCRPPPCHR